MGMKEAQFMQNRLFKPPKLYNRKLSVMNILKKQESDIPVIKDGHMKIKAVVFISEGKKYKVAMKVEASLKIGDWYDLIKLNIIDQIKKQRDVLFEVAKMKLGQLN